MLASHLLYQVNFQLWIDIKIVEMSRFKKISRFLTNNTCLPTSMVDETIQKMAT